MLKSEITKQSNEEIEIGHSLVNEGKVPKESATLEQPSEDAAIPINLHKTKTNQHLIEYNREASNIYFSPMGSSENYPGNYDNYLRVTLSHIANMGKIKFDYALEDPELYRDFPSNTIERISKSKKKILLLDLDETLVHADFNEEFANSKTIKYDTVLSFKEKSGKNLNINGTEKTDENISPVSNIPNESQNIITVGIFLRPGVNEFLSTVSKYFEIGIFTASLQEYADATINYLDPDKKFIKFRLYRNSCINVNDLIKVKDLRILKGIDLKNIVLLDNSMYSFAPQLSNGILINSFYTDKTDNELSNVLGYLLNYILPANDVRKVNQEFFGFKTILDELSQATN